MPCDKPDCPSCTLIREMAQATEKFFRASNPEEADDACNFHMNVLFALAANTVIGFAEGARDPQGAFKDAIDLSKVALEATMRLKAAQQSPLLLTMEVSGRG